MNRFNLLRMAGFYLALVVMVLILPSSYGYRVSRTGSLNRFESLLRSPVELDDDDDELKNVTNWAVLVAGSNGFGNYRHQVCKFQYFFYFKFLCSKCYCIRNSILNAGSATDRNNINMCVWEGVNMCAWEGVIVLLI